jgi:hypothetical protein
VCVRAGADGRGGVSVCRERDGGPRCCGLQHVRPTVRAAVDMLTRTQLWSACALPYLSAPVDILVLNDLGEWESSVYMDGGAPNFRLTLSKSELVAVGPDARRCTHCRLTMAALCVSGRSTTTVDGAYVCMCALLEWGGGGRGVCVACRSWGTHSTCPSRRACTSIGP